MISWSRVKQFSGSPSQSLQVRNFSTIHASRPAGESFSATPSVSAASSPARCAYAAFLALERRHRREVGLFLLGDRERLRRRGGDRHVEVERGAVLGVERREPGRDLRAPVAALRAVARVAEAPHQLDERVRDAPDVPTRSARRLGERRTPAAKARPRGTRPRRDRRAASGSVSRGMTSRNSTTEPGQPCTISSGSASACGDRAWTKWI